MFIDPGKKIKTVATVYFYLVLIGGFITGLVIGIEEDFAFFFLIFGGSLIVGYLSSLLLYGFGELIESSLDTSIATQMILDRLDHHEKDGPVSVPPRPAAPAAWNAVSPAAPAVRSAASPAAPAPAPAARGASASGMPNGKWQCLCGRINEKYVSSCACGRNKREVFSLARTEEDQG